MHTREDHDHDDDDLWTQYSKIWEFVATWLTSSYWIRDLAADFADDPSIKDSLPLIILSNVLALWAAYGASHCHGNVNLAHQMPVSVNTDEEGAGAEADELMSPVHEQHDHHHHHAHNHHQENKILYFMQLSGDYFAHTSSFAAPMSFIIQLSSGARSYSARMLTNVISISIAGMASVAEIRTCKNIKDQLIVKDKFSSSDITDLAGLTRADIKVFNLPKPDFWSVFNGATETSTNLVNIGYWAGSLVDGFFNLSPKLFQLSKPALIVGSIMTIIASGSAYNHVRLATTYQKHHEHNSDEEKVAPLTLAQKISRPGDMISHLTDAVAPGTFVLELHTPYRSMPQVGKALCLLGVFAVGAPAAIANSRTCKTNLERSNYKIKLLEEAGLQRRPPSL